MNLLEQVVSPDNMDKAWRRLYKDRSRWDRTTSRSEFERRSVFHLQTLVDQLRTETYRPGSVRQFRIAKDNGSKRLLSALYLRDKLAQRAVLQIIEQLGEACFDDDSFGYRPGRSVDMACSRAVERIDCGYPWLVDADLESFFDTIPHGLLLKAMGKLVPDRKLNRLFALWLKQSTLPLSFLSSRKGLAQGAVLSPFQCNVYLNLLDRFWRKNGIPFVRFADDFLLFAGTEKAAFRVLEMTNDKLTELKLAFNTEKTRVCRASRDVVFLGRQLRGPRD